MSLCLETKCLHLDKQADESKPAHYGAVSFPIYQTATYAHPAVGQSTGFDYSRLQNPTREQVEKIMAQLEGGIDALALSSGMAAISCLAKIFAPGDDVLVSSDLYGGTWRIFNVYETYGVHFHYIDTSDFALVKKSLTANTKAIFIETPSNPMMKVTDIRACADLIHAHRKDGVCISDFESALISRIIVCRAKGRFLTAEELVDAVREYD